MVDYHRGRERRQTVNAQLQTNSFKAGGSYAGEWRRAKRLAKIEDYKGARRRGIGARCLEDKTNTMNVEGSLQLSSAVVSHNEGRLRK